MATGKTLRIVELSKNPWENRWKAFTQIAQEEAGIIIQASTQKVEDSTFAKDLEGVLRSDADICCVDGGYGSKVLEYLPRMTQEAQQVGAVDMLIREEGTWWPRCYFNEAFTRALSQYVGQVDLKSQALIAGTNSLASLTIDSLIRFGFSKINIAEKDSKKGEDLVRSLAQRYFQVDFKFIPMDDVTTLPGVHSIMVNASPLEIENDFLDELYFFNFLKPEGVVVDLGLVPRKTPLIEEARQWGARHLSGDFIFAERDALILERRFQLKLPVEKYWELLTKDIDAVPFDPAPYLRRFRER